MTKDILLRQNTITEIDRASTDKTALPADASLIIESDWAEMIKLAGTESELLKRLGIAEDSRQDA